MTPAATEPMIERTRDREIVEIQESRTMDPGVPPPAKASVLSIVRTTADRRNRAERLERTDLPWVSSVKLGWGLEVRLVNMSSTGMLLETGSKLTPGSITELRLSGPDIDITIPVKFVRSEVADAHHLGIRFHTAAVFEKPIEIPSDQNGGVRSLGQMLAQVSSELAVASHANLTAALQEGIRRAISAQQVRILAAPIDLTDGGESIAVAIPTSDRSPATLQADFAPGWQPTDLDLKLLTAAAGLAAVVLEFGN